MARPKYADRPTPRNYGSRSDAMFHGSNLTEEEIQFALAMDQYKRNNHRPFPTWTEVLDVLRSLGYRKGEPT